MLKKGQLETLETLQDAEKHLYSDIYNYLYPLATSPVERKQHLEDKERSERAKKRITTRDEQQVRRTK